MRILLARAARAAALVAVVGSVSSCGSSGSEAVPARIRESNDLAIARVVLRPENMIDPEEIDIWLAPGVSDSEANRVWCEVIVPAGGSQDGDHVSSCGTTRAQV